MSVGVDFDFARWIAHRRGSMEQQAREGAIYAFSGERKFRRTLAIARPVTMALEATTRLWRDVARSELLGTAVKVSDVQYPRVWNAAKIAGEALRVRVPAVFAAPSDDIKVKVLGTEDAPHLIVNLELAEKLDETDLVAAIGHELGHVQNGHILFATALHYLTSSAIFFVRWVVQPAIMTLQAWSRRAEVTCDRAALLCVKDLDKTLNAMVKLELGLDKGSAFSAEEYLKSLPDTKKGIGRFAEMFRSYPYVPKRVQALRLFADSQLYAQVLQQDPVGKPSLADVDKQVSELISVF
ncbi:MAG: M48 family metallopeptidase [Deltaproteobacteria bacterium]|nr:M48 family metallopeptidase [Deltaproteobacteria bacterium]MCW5800814.1 M48 family metallopeptidase [Deltaproteobacteria bacterium]